MPDFSVRSRKIAERFLQSAVVVDDRAWMGSRQMQPTIEVSLATPDYGSSLTTSDQGPETFEDNERVVEPEDVGLDAEAVTNGFAEFGVVCAVLNPVRPECAEPDDLEKNIVQAAARSDIVVLDWKIGEFINGESTLRILGSILQTDIYASKLRLFAIYTTEPNLASISDQVKASLKNLRPDVGLSDESMRISQGPISVVLLAKEGTEGAIDPELAGQVVGETELPDRLIEEFALITGGLLRNVALAGLTALREGAHQLLTQFDTSLDPAYLGHRMLLPNTSDAEDHVVEALGSEILSILEDRRIGLEAGTDSIGEWLSQEENSDFDLACPVAIPDNSTPNGTWMKLLDKGKDNDARKELNLSHSKWKTLWATLEKEATHIFTSDATAATQSNRGFAALLGLKTRYANQQAARLTLGTILSEDSGELNYFLCLQPKCDSVRLKIETGFPLLPLDVKEDVGSNTKFSIVVQKGSNQWVYLDYVPKPRNLIVAEFRPGPNPPGEVVACECTSPAHFRDTAGKVYSFVAEMRDEQALRVAGELATAIARPGPNDSEWLRLSSPRRR